jgi:NADP-dependent 3-hydroxy acid dehydrogenase YdfG
MARRINVNEEGLLDGLKNVIQQIMNQNTDHKFHQMSADAGTLIAHEQGGRLYAALKEVVMQHLQTEVSQS